MAKTKPPDSFFASLPLGRVQRTIDPDSPTLTRELLFIGSAVYEVARNADEPPTNSFLKGWVMIDGYPAALYQHRGDANAATIRWSAAGRVLSASARRLPC